MIGKSNYHFHYNPVLIEKMLEEQDSENFSRQDPKYFTKLISISTHPIQMVVDIGNGRSESIRIMENDDPLLLARKFCFENNLDIKIINALAKNIRNFMSTSFKVGDATLNCVSQKVEGIQQSNRRTGLDSHSSLRVSKDTKNKRMTGTVFQRLYNKSKIRTEPNIGQRQNKNPNISNAQHHTSSNSLINNGVLIYQRNTRLSEENKRKLQMRFDQINNMKDNEHTFQPNINQISRLMVEKMRELIPEESIQQKNSRLKKQKLIQIQHQKQRKQRENCTFRPKTNRPTNHSKSSDRFINLYQDHNNRALKKQKTKTEIQNQFDFHPQINSLSDMMVTGLNFDQRLKKYQYEKMIKEDKIKRDQNYKNVIQPETGQILYQPKIGKPPEKRNKQKLPVYLHLYNGRFQREKSLLKLRQSMTASIYTIDNSSRIYQSTKQSSLQELFEILDSDRDGYISSAKINISNVQPKVLKLLAPLLNQMQQLEVQLNEQEFLEAIQRLFKTLTIHQKDIIIKHNRKKKQIQPLKFKPVLNEKSLMIANNRRANKRPPTTMSIYDFYEQKREQSLHTKVSVKGLKQLQECTFQPKPTSLNNSKSKRTAALFNINSHNY